MSDKITYEDKVGIKPKTVRKNQVQDLDMNEIKDKHNNLDDRVIAIESSGVTGVTPIDVNAEWTSGLSFDVTADNYPVLGAFYSSTSATVTLDAADPTLDRIDLIVAIAPISPATVGTVGKITGTPATTALVVEPDYDPSLVYPIKQAIVRASATEPESTSKELVYDENVGTPIEFAFTSNSGNIVNSTNDAFSGTNSIEGTNVTAGNRAILTRVSTESTSNVDLLTFYVKLKSDFEDNYILIKFFNGTSQVGNTYIFKNGDNGFDSSILTWQKISINSSKLGLPVTDFDNIEIYFYKNFSGFFLDLIQIHNGSGSEPITKGVEEAPIDGKSYNRRDASWVEDSTIGDTVKVSPNDIAAGFLNGKLVAGTNITLVEDNDGGDETLTINSTGGCSVNPTRVDMGVSNVIDWTNPNGVFLKTMTTPTTFIDDNLPTGIDTKKISIYMQGGFLPTFPNYWKKTTSKNYALTSVNRLNIECVNGNTGVELVYYDIEAVSFAIPIQLGEPFVWFDASDFDSLDLSPNDYVDKWLDKSGNGNDAFNDEPIEVDSFRANDESLNSLNTLTIRANWMQTQNFGVQSQANTFVFVAKSNNASNTFMFDGIDATDSQSLATVDFFDYALNAGSELKMPENVASGTWEIFVCIFNGVNSKIIRNGVFTTTGDAGANSIKGLTLGAKYDKTANKLGNFADFIMYNNLVSDADINTTCNYLATKWGLSWTDI